MSHLNRTISINVLNQTFQKFPHSGYLPNVYNINPYLSSKHSPLVSGTAKGNISLVSGHLLVANEKNVQQVTTRKNFTNTTNLLDGGWR